MKPATVYADEDLRAGVVSLARLGEKDFANYRGREADLGTVEAVLVGRVAVGMDADEVELERAELALSPGERSAAQRRAVEEAQRKLDQARQEMDNPALRAEMKSLAAQQAELGKQQAELGRQQAAASAKANRDAEQMIREAISSGIARPLGG